jgi:hypothetical protein
MRPASLLMFTVWSLVQRRLKTTDLEYGEIMLNEEKNNI